LRTEPVFEDRCWLVLGERPGRSGVWRQWAVPGTTSPWHPLDLRRGQSGCFPLAPTDDWNADNVSC